MVVEVGEYKVYESGIIIGIKDAPIRFLIEDLTFEVVFEKNIENLSPSSKVEATGQKTLRITFCNYDNSLGMGNVLPAKVGNLQNELDLFFSYRVYTLNDDTGKTLHYTWLTKKKEK